MTIAVFGSINMDLVARTPRLPLPGETLIGHTFDTFPGGKGANQAVACARLGASTWMVGRVGGDGFGETLLRGLQTEGVRTDAVQVDTEAVSGVALITVDDQAENTIIVISGANARVDKPDLNRLAGIAPEVKVLLLQLEVPIEMSMRAAEIARQHGAKVLLDPAPARPIPEAFYPMLDVLTPNETEASALVGFPIKGTSDVARAADVLIDRGARHVIIKLGSLGAFSGSKAEGKIYPAFPVTAVDTVAAGDAFNGGLAVALSEGNSMDNALNWGLAAGALAVTKEGAQTAMPDRSTILSLIQKTAS